MGLSQSSFVPECSCELEHLSYSTSAIHKHKFCPLCNRVLSKERRKKVQDIYRKHQSLNDAMFRRGKSINRRHSSSIRSLPSTVDISSHMGEESLSFYRPSTSSSSSSSSTNTTTSTSSSSSSTQSTLEKQSTKIYSSSMKDMSSSGKVEHFSPLTRKLRSNSSKNLIFLSNGGNLPANNKSILRFKRNTLPAVNLTLPPITYPQSEPSPKIAINLGGAFHNHGTKSLPIYVIPPQEAPEITNDKSKSLTDHKSKRQEKKIKRKVKY